MDASIGFFDGFNGILVLIVYASLIGFTVIYQLVRRKLAEKKRGSADSNDESGNNLLDDSQNNYLPDSHAHNSKRKNINDSAVSS